MTKLLIESPSKKKSIELTFDREVHFGPFLFKAKLFGFNISEPLDTITENICWSNSEEYVAVVEVTYDNLTNENTSNLKVINTKAGSITNIDSRKGLIIPTSISNSGIVQY